MNKSSKLCLIESCRKEVTRGYSIPYEKPKIAEKWLSFLNQHSQKLPSNLEVEVICPLHFTENDFIRKRGKVTKNLNKKAFPTMISNGLTSVKLERREEEQLNGIESTSKRKKLPKTAITESESDEESEEEFDEDEHSQDVTIRFFPSRKESPLMFHDYPSDEEIDSDLEPVYDEPFEVIKNELAQKTNSLQDKEHVLKEMEEIVVQQEMIIARLKYELDELKQLEKETESKSGVNDEKVKTAESDFVLKMEPGIVNGFAPPAHNMEINDFEAALEKVILSTEEVKGNVPDYSNSLLRLFSISLLYFSPRAFKYVGTVLSTLPPKEVVLEWVRSGQARTLFPPGLMFRENKFFADN